MKDQKTPQVGAQMMKLINDREALRQVSGGGAVKTPSPSKKG